MTRTTYDDGELESVVLLSGRGTNNSFFIIESSVSCFLPSQRDVFKLFWSNEPLKNPKPIPNKCIFQSPKLFMIREQEYSTSRTWDKTAAESFVVLKWHSAFSKQPFIQRSLPQGWVSSSLPRRHRPLLSFPPIVVQTAGCAGARASLALLCSWGIWHAKQPDGSLSLSLSHSVSIMLAPWPKIVWSAVLTPAGGDNVVAYIKHLSRRA